MTYVGKGYGARTLNKLVVYGKEEYNICVWCKREFIPNIIKKVKQKYCSEKCRRHGSAEKRGKKLGWKEFTPGKAKKYNKWEGVEAPRTVKRVR